MAVYVLIPAGKIALGKLSQAMMHQATVIQVEGNFDQALTIVKELSATYPVELVNSLNPYRIEGRRRLRWRFATIWVMRRPSMYFL